MKNSYLDRQKIDATENYNYFMVKLITSILMILFKLSVVLLLGSIFENNILIIFEVLFTIYSLYKTNYALNYYLDIMKDIKDTVKIEDNYYELSIDLVEDVFLNRITK